MRRKAAALFMATALGGCMSFHGGPETGGGPTIPHWGKSYGPPTVPGVKGPYGENVAMAAPYDTAPPASAFQARQMMSQSVPLSAVQFNYPAQGMGGAGQMPPGAMPMTGVPRGPILTPPGVPFSPGVPAGQNVPSAPSMFPGAPGGMMPTGGMMPANMPPGGGLINANIRPGTVPPGGLMQAQMVQANANAVARFQAQRTQIRFVRPSGMKVSWFTQGPDGKPMFSTTPVEAPGRYNFPQAAIYRLKLSNIEGRPGLEIYPTMEVVPCNPRTEAFLAHSAVPIEFTNEDFKQVAEGNYLVKVIYLPDPQFQDSAGTGTDEILSTRLEPGADPIQEALRRGSILLVLRMGNVDQEAPNTPPLNAPGPNAAPPMPPPMMPSPGAGMPSPGMQVPYWGMKPGMPMPGPGSMMGGPGGSPVPGPINVPSSPLMGPGGQGQFPPAMINPQGFPAGVPPLGGETPPVGGIPTKTAPGISSTSRPPNSPTRMQGAVPPLPPPVPPGALPTAPTDNALPPPLMPRSSGLPEAPTIPGVPSPAPGSLTGIPTMPMHDE